MEIDLNLENGLFPYYFALNSALKLSFANSLA